MLIMRNNIILQHILYVEEIRDTYYNINIYDRHFCTFLYLNVSIIEGKIICKVVHTYHLISHLIYH